MVSEHTLRIHDLEFVPFIGHIQLLQRIKELGTAINNAFQDLDPVFIPILNGAFMFASDLLKEVCIPCEVSFVKVASYSGEASGGEVKQLLGLQQNLTGRHIILVEDIIDTGLTMQSLLKQLEAEKPASITVCTLFVKPEAIRVPIQIDYAGFEIANKFIVGYGLDYNGKGRNYPDVYQKSDEGFLTK